jgi:hypothetical protein|tara:strand:- start:1088 stop:1318 length:231 start_codon:yes stop_codon:yes gene_type:complete
MEKQLSSEELNQVKNLQEQTQQVTMQLGAVEIKKMQLKDLIQNLQQQEEQIAKTLSNKYGIGTLDIDTGKLTITEN